MATTRRKIEADHDTVWAVLADGGSCERWVVGAKEVRRVDDAWPAAGAEFDHTVGIGPLTVHDVTRSVSADPPRRLVLDARFRPLGRARVELVLDAHPDGTLVSITEHLTSPMVMRWLDPLFGPLIRARNAESLRRLDELARGRSRT